VTEEEVTKEHDGKVPAGKILLKDLIADAMFPAGAAQAIRVRPHHHSQPERRLPFRRLRGQVGVLGMAPGSNIGDYLAVFEATHGTAPKYAGQDIGQPRFAHSFGGDDA
jgi:isocitrate dehydrogenase